MTDQQRIIADRYVLGEFIGQGGMSLVYRGLDNKLGRQVAIKILKSDLSNDEMLRSRFKAESQAASRMAHPTIVRVYDAGEQVIETADGTSSVPYIVMEYVEGQDLRQLLSKNPLGQREACMIVEDVLTALEYSHKAGVIHRDIKPANIMITKTGQVKVMDFGIARAISESSTSVEHTTAILGTAAYFSPEQAKGDSVDARTDLYSTGVVLYELLTGTVPFKGDSAVSVAYQHVSERPVAPSERKESVTPALDKVVLKALAKDKNKRFQTAAEFREFLKDAASGKVPDFEVDQGGLDALLGAAAVASASDSVRELSGSGGVRTQIRPPVMWTWAAIITIGVIIVAGMYWLANLSSMSITPADTRVIPEMVGITEKEAKAMLDDLDLTYRTVLEASEDTVSGRVLRSDPEAGTRVRTGENIKLYISKCRDSIDIPDVTLLTVSDAITQLEDAGLKIGTVSKEDHPSLGADVVISTTPGSGTTVKPGKTVNLVVSTGMVTVPDVKGQTMAVARDVLSQLQLGVQMNGQTGCAPQTGAPVTSQSAVGQQKQGITVTLTYCAG